MVDVAFPRCDLINFVEAPVFKSHPVNYKMLEAAIYTTRYALNIMFK